MVHVEFTIEPFVEGEPGAHVLSAIAAARAHGADVEIGPFGSDCTVDASRAGAIVGAVVDAALGNGATHISVHVESGR